MTKRQLSPRLEAALSLAGSCDTIYDIGCDHGHLALAMLARGLAVSACFCDISPRALENAMNNAKKAGLFGRARFVPGDGFIGLFPGEADIACICGIGGTLAAGMLKRGPLPQCPIVFQVNGEAEVLRREAENLGLSPSDERLVLDRGRYYQLMRFERASQPQLTPLELRLGPVLLKNRPPLLEEYVARKIAFLEKAYKKAEQDEKDAAAIKKELDLLRQVSLWLPPNESV